MKFKLLIAAAAMSFAAAQADAASLAIFGQNGIGSLYASGGDTVTYVTDTQLATAGFLDAFDAFVYTRDGFSFGSSLSAAAAANVRSFVTGNVVLFAGDFADDIGTENTDRLFNNALAYVLADGGKGYIGEFTGALAAYATNGNGTTPIGLIQGDAGILQGGGGGSNGDVQLTPNGANSPLVQGVTFPYNPGAVEFGFDQSGFNPAAVVAQFSNGTPAILASGIDEISAPVPEPATWGMMILGFGVVGASARTRSRRVRFAA